MIRFIYLPKFSIVIIFSFILVTVIGTISHEFGHIAVAKYFGYDTTLDYGSMNYYPRGYLEDSDLKEINSLVEKYNYNNYEAWPNEIKLTVEELSESLDKKYPSISLNHTFWIIMGGPAQTLLTSCLGLFILFMRRKKWSYGFKSVDWIAVFMALFALREVFNFVTASYSSIFNSKSHFHADEFRISTYLGFNEWVIPILTLILGLLMSCYVIFKILPIKYRFTFILSGLVGGITGYALWFGVLVAALFNSTGCF